MTMKSVIDIDVNDEKFKDFEALFSKYQSRLEKMPGAWANVDKGIKKSFESVAAALLAQNEIAANAAKAEKDLEKNANRTAGFWKDMAKSTKTVASNIKAATTSLLRWVGVTSIVSGLIGGGGLFGLDVLAVSAGGARRSSLGLGTTIGEQRAFGLNFGRVISPDSYLSNVNAALHDVTKRSALYGAGLHESDITGKDTAQIAVALIPLLKRLADQTPSNLLGQTLQSRGLDQFITLEDFERLRNTSASELKDYAGQYGQDARELALNDQTARTWQNFDRQLSVAGRKIETAFITGLEPLIPALTRFSDAVAKSITTFLKSDTLKHWLSEFGEGIEIAAKYIGSPKFQSDIIRFVDDIAALANAIEDVLKFFGYLVPKMPSTSRGGGAFYSPGHMTRKQLMLAGINPSGITDSLAPAGAGPRSIHNPGNLRPANSKGFLQFANDADGIRAMGHLLQIYEDRHHLDTITGIVSRYAPRADHNDTAGYIRAIAARTGFGAGQHLDLHDRTVLARLISAMTKQENRKSNFPTSAVIEILNNTGGSAIVASNQIAR